jgi:hypothetical protein
MREPLCPDDQPPAQAEAEASKPRHPKRRSTAQSIGGVLFGFEQQVWRTAPPPQELVHHARPDAPVPAADGTMLTIEYPPTLDEPGDPPAPGDRPAAGDDPRDPAR